MGGIAAIAGQFTLPVPVWPLGAAVDSLWLVAAGAVMLRKDIK